MSKRTKVWKILFQAISAVSLLSHGADMWGIIKANHHSASLGEYVFGGRSTEGVALLHNAYTYPHHTQVIRLYLLVEARLQNDDDAGNQRGGGGRTLHRIYAFDDVYTLSKITVLYVYYYYYYQRLKSVPRVFERLPWCASFCGFKIHFHAHTRTATANPYKLYEQSYKHKHNTHSQNIRTWHTFREFCVRVDSASDDVMSKAQKVEGFL